MSSTADDGLAQRVRDARKARGWTQDELAEKANIHTRTVQNLEGGKSTPQGGNLRAILRALDLDDSQEATAEATREEWPLDVRVYLDILGAILASMPEAEREVFMRAETRILFQNRV